MTKKKTTYDTKIARKLAKSEANPPRIKSYAKNNISPKLNSLLVGGVVALLVVIISIFTWVQITNQMAMEKEHHKFAQLQGDVTSEGSSLKKVAPNLSGWVQESSCYHTDSTVLFGGSGWTCSSEWTGNLPLGNVSEAHAMVAQFESSPLYEISIKADLSKLMNSDSATNPSVGFSDHGYDKGTGASCGLGFKILDGKNRYVSTVFNCMDYAKASWYPNTEPNPALPGHNAYKQ